MYLLDRLPRETNRDHALRTIKENIISLDLAPGSQISESELSAQMGLSRTPVREALLELSKVKIVEITPQKPSVIARINYDLVEESHYLRDLLERSVVQLACSMAAPEDVARLEENVHLQEFYLSRNAAKQLMSLDDQFHCILFEIAQRSQIYALTQNFYIHFDRVRWMALDSVKELKIVEDHAAILEAVRNGQPERAQELMAMHLTRYKVDAAAIRARYPEYF